MAGARAPHDMTGETAALVMRFIGTVLRSMHTSSAPKTRTVAGTTSVMTGRATTATRPASISAITKNCAVLSSSMLS